MPENILAAFEHDIATCHAMANLLKADRAFVNAFLAADKRRDKSLDTFLRKSPYSATPEFRYVLQNRQYFDIDVSYHGATNAVSWVKNDAIYCAPTLQRLRDIEAHGESRQAWTIREFFLDKALANLSQPGDPTTDGKADFSELESLVAEASQKYTGTQRPAFLAWIRKAAATIEAGRNGNLERTSGGPASSPQQTTIDERLRFLRGFL